jgi:uncharacterized protein
MKKVWLFFGIPVLVYGVACALAYWFQELVIVHPVPLPRDHEYHFPWPLTDTLLPTPDGAELNVLWFRAPQPRGVVVYYHGNAGNLDRWGHVAGDLVGLGHDVVIWDYRSFGKSTGQLSEASLLQDAQQVYDLAKQHYPEAQITVFGRSLGTGPAACVAAHNRPRQLILETPYYNLHDLAARYVPLLPHRWLLRYHLTTDQWLNQARCPVHIFHGTDDEIVPYESGQKLAKLLKPGDTFTTLPGGTHHNLGQYHAYQRHLAQLLR